MNKSGMGLTLPEYGKAMGFKLNPMADRKKIN